MSTRLNANEVFLMAERMEQNAAAFYRRAAELNPSEHNKRFLHKVAHMEDGHKQMEREQGALPQARSHPHFAQ